MKINFCSLHTLFICLLSGTAFSQTLLPDAVITPENQHVVINLAQQRLFFYQDGRLATVYPIAVGKARTKTPTGEYDVKYVARNPTWSVPKSIQKEMAASGKTVLTSVPPGPNNPLGPVFIRFGDPKLGLGIHGTNAPSSVPGVRSHGCVRMKSPDALKIAKIIQKETPVSVIYQLASLNVDGSGQLWLAAYTDPYNNKNFDKAQLLNTIKRWSESKKTSVNNARIEQVLKARSGQATCISCTNAKNNKVAGELTPLAWTIGEITHPTPEPKEILPKEALPQELLQPLELKLEENENTLIKTEPLQQEDGNASRSTPVAKLL